MEQFVLGHLEVLKADKWDKEGMNVPHIHPSFIPTGQISDGSPQSLQISGQIVK